MTLREALAHRALPFLLCAAAVVFLRFGGFGSTDDGRTTAVALGFLLVGAFLAGKAAKRVRLPRITGYLLVGLAIGPFALGLLTKEMLAGARAVEGLAVALIALTAGGEIKIAWVKQQIRRLALITACELTLVALGVLTVVFFGRELFPFVPSDDIRKAAVIAMVFGAIAVANSPTVTIAVIAENRAEGPVSRTVLGVTVLKDVCVIVLFAIAIAVARNALGEGGGESLAMTLGRELGGSVLVGVGVGIGIAWFLRRIDRDTPVFVLAVCFAVSEIAAAFHLETLLIALTAGFWVENFSKARGERLIHGIERVSLPVYALFFATAGAKVDLDALVSMWPLALLLTTTRAACVWLGTATGARLARAEPEVVQYAWLGFISQAGVTLALATIVGRAFPTWGAEVQVLVIAMIALHELIGPIAFQFALKRAGEIGAAPSK